MKQEKENAVSPVVGVMLMLVVTIIIAALVSSFAGGLGTTTEKTPLVTFTAEYGQLNGLVLRSTGASDSLVYGEDFQIYINTPSDENSFSNVLNASRATTGNGAAFTGGNVIYFSYDALSDWYNDDVGGRGANSGGAWTAIGWMDNTGKTLKVKLVGNDGKVYGQASTLVTK